MKIGIFVGSFNPPHKGHRKIVEYLINEKILDKIEIIPTGNYWNKQDLISINDRINMLKYLENDNIYINNELNNLEYTYLIMRMLKNKYIDDTLYLIMGDDNYKNFDKWKNYEELLTYKVIVIKREGIKVNNEYYINKYFEKGISSSYIKNHINNDLSKYLDKEVINYIKIHNLYK